LNYRPDKRYPKNWNHRRQAVFKAVGYICQMCGRYSKGNLHYHHIIPVGCGGRHIPMNMIPVCKQCHEYIHSGNYKGPFLDLRKYKGKR
jgi:5-methylcytosine-specific restriction endonuclease McrA